MTGQLSITIPAMPAEQATLADTVEDFLAAHDVPPAISIKVMIALDEMVTNIVTHAYDPSATDPFVTIELAITAEAVNVEIIDAGRAFDPLAAPLPDTSLGIDEREIGGLGILLVRRQMDSVRYERRDGRNRLSLVKRLA